MPGETTPVVSSPQDSQTAGVAATGVLTATVDANVTISPVPTSGVVIIPRTPSPQNNEARWRAQQIDRQVLPQALTYIAKNPAPLLWYDPLTGQSIEIGALVGEFRVQARFTLRGGNSPALEVPYRINADYGLTSISDAVRERMRAAGYTESVEAYVLQTVDVEQK